MENNTRESQIVALLTGIQVPLLLYVRSLMPGDPAARDVVQNANVTIWEKHKDFEIGTNFKAWAFSIARFEVLNYRKQQERDARLIFSAELEEIFTKELVNHQDDLQRHHEALQHCLGKLRSKDRELILHRYFEKGTLGDYAQKVGRSIGGLKVSLHRLRNTLLTCIQKQIQSDERTA